ncbi:uncharacterized protein LOC128276524, partial [Anopheles cruzii]|uniref:uncharacterized protein LOC128276524 n=1 Tax=Anopheles cruzii TaxID=68878 RepID=UPI0022EC955B
MGVTKTQASMNAGSVPKMFKLDDDAGTSSLVPQGLYNYNHNSLFMHMPKEEIKHEPGESPKHNATNQYQLQPMQGMMNTQSTSPGPDRSPSNLTPSPVMMGGPISPHDPGSITPTPPAYTTLNGPVGNLYFEVTMANQQHHHNATNPMFDLSMPGPSNGWVQPVPTTNQNGLNRPMDQTPLNVGSFGSLPLVGDPTLGMVSTSIPNNVTPQSMSCLPSMNSDINLNMVDFEPVLNSSEIRYVLGTFSNSDLNRLAQVAQGQQTGTSYPQQSTNIPQQTVKTPLAGQQQQQQQQQMQPMPDLNDND